ncbi:beta-class carbonic anhydrase [Leptospira wolffii]|uniref:Beta-class carbonic anhydrase n=1 Tax=Leptospira wolffii TaxID=409998 RepID=A0ABV5BSM5_9LEPT|nr:carbonic anhydrase [Leptospira wolffii]EPG66758.1 carbonate dehydratase [Leptospira wolffii serovar Khorat str. Khorat-H2]TGL54591.1 carbonic anhydrase [Leptospira wolffii]
MSNSILQKESSKVHKEVIEANQKYVSEFGKKGELPLPPGRSFTILTCMDARLDPAKYAGLSEGDAHVIRNAGGRASDDAIRSLIISYKLLGTKEFFVIHHSDCGMQLFTDPIIRNLLAKSLKTATVDANGWRNLEESGGSDEAKYIPFLTFEDLEKSVIDDVKRIRNHPLIPKDIPIYGYYYDVKTGKLVEVGEATKIGRAT